MQIANNGSRKAAAALVSVLSCLLLTLCLAACSPDTAPKDDPSAGSSADSSIYDSYTFESHEKLVEDTAYLADELYSNPHDSHYGSLLCVKCHKAGDDGQNQLWCTKCHEGMDLPEGWEAYDLGVK